MSVDQNLRLYKVEQLEKIARAIRTKLGSSDTYTIDEMCTAIQGIPVGADVMALLASASESIVGTDGILINDDTVKSESTVVPSYFGYHKAILSVSFAEVTEVRYNAFCHAIRLTNVNLPKCVTIGESAFDSIPYQAATDVTINLPKVVTIGQSAFSNSKVSGLISLPECETIGNSAFRACGKITGLYLPKVKTLGDVAFGYGDNKTYDVNLPLIVTIGEQAFRRYAGTNFTIGPNCTSIGRNLFYDGTCTNLYVLATTPPTLAGNFSSSVSDVSHIYVPADSVAAYKSANVWSNYSSVIEAIPAA